MKALEIVRLSPHLALRNARWLLVPRRVQIIPVEGFQMSIDPRPWRWDLKEDSIMKQLYLDRTREPLATRFLRSFIDHDERILELGANIGYYVLLEKNIAPKATIYAVEPDPRNFRMLKKNLALNSIKDVSCDCLAMADRAGTAKLFIDKASNFHTLVDRGHGLAIDVATTTVDEFCKGKRITFLRMDIEGYETKVIKGMSKSLRSSSLCKLFVEIHPHLVPYKEMRAFLSVLRDHGFDIATAISRDNILRKKLGQAREERIPITQFIDDPRLRSRSHAFEVFFKR